MHFVSIWRKVICIESSYGLAIFCTAFSSLRKIVCFVPISVSYIIWGNALWTRRPYQELALDHRVGWCGSTENDQFTAILTIFFYWDSVAEPTPVFESSLSKSFFSISLQMQSHRMPFDQKSKDNATKKRGI